MIHSTPENKNGTNIVIMIRLATILRIHERDGVSSRIFDLFLGEETFLLAILDFFLPQQFINAASSFLGA